MNDDEPEGPDLLAIKTEMVERAPAVSETDEEECARLAREGLPRTDEVKDFEHG